MEDLNELKLNYHISIRNIRGEKDDSLANCYGTHCRDLKGGAKRKIYKETCHQKILRDAIGKLGSVVGKCNYADHPSACRRAVGRMIRIYKDRMETSQKRMKDAKSTLIASKVIRRK